MVLGITLEQVLEYSLAQLKLLRAADRRREADAAMLQLAVNQAAAASVMGGREGGSLARTLHAKLLKAATT